jgi:hypothetical protein
MSKLYCCITLPVSTVKESSSDAGLYIILKYIKLEIIYIYIYIPNDDCLTVETGSVIQQ